MRKQPEPFWMFATKLTLAYVVGLGMLAVIWLG